MTRDVDDAEEHARRVWRRAVQRELDAIRAHEQAAARHEEIAAQHEQAAVTAAGDARDHLARFAARERVRAELARGRAGAARRRLRQEGVDPDARQ